MSDEDTRETGGGVRRVSSKDRKKRLDVPGPIIPPEDEPFLPPIDEPDVELPESEPSEETRPHTLEELDRLVADPLRRTPPDEEDRFPPIAPPPLEDADIPLETVKPRRRVRRADLVAVFFLLASIVMCVYYAVLWNNPFTPINLFAPPTPFIVITTTPDPNAIQPIIVAPTQSFQQEVPTENPDFVFSTPTLVGPGAGDSGADSAFPFALADTGVVFAPNSNGRGCNWASIAGSVTGMQGEPLSGYGVGIKGGVTGAELDEKVFSGSAQTFGQGGFELPLGGAPLEADFVVQLFNPVGVPVSDAVSVTTRADCDHNVAIINFVQQRGL